MVVSEDFDLMSGYTGGGKSRSSILDRAARRQNSSNLNVASIKETTQVPSNSDKEDKQDEVNVAEIKEEKMEEKNIKVADKSNEKISQPAPSSSKNLASETADSSALLIDLFESMEFVSFNSTSVLSPNNESAVKTTFNSTSMASPSDTISGQGSNKSSLLPLQTMEEYAVSQKMTRVFHLADFMFNNSVEALNKPDEFSLAYFEHFTSSLTFYIKELNHLAIAGNEGHFLMITKKIQQLQKHLGDLDRFKVRASIKNGDNCKSSSLNDDCNDNSSKHQLTNISTSSFPSASSPLPPLSSVEKIVPFDGDILHWLHFASTFLAAIKTITDPAEQYRLLYNNLDSASRERFLAEVNPLKPDIPAFFERLSRYYEDNPEQIFSLTKVSLRRLPLLKNRNCSASWLALMGAANRAKALLALHKDKGKNNTGNSSVAGFETALVSVLLDKLPPLFQNLFKDGLPFGQQPNLTLFARFCDQQVATISERQVAGLLPNASSQKDGEEGGNVAVVAERLCPICEGDYHFAEQCEFDLVVRLEAVAAKELCHRCLQQWSPEEFENGHNCPNKSKRCDGCGDTDHHVALCPVTQCLYN